MTLYSIDKLIEETRRLAADFRRSTGQPLPVSGEIFMQRERRLKKPIRFVVVLEIKNIDCVGLRPRNDEIITYVIARSTSDEAIYSH